MEHSEQPAARRGARRARFVAAVVVLLGVLGAGLAGGWIAASQRSSGASGHGHGHGAGEAEDEHAGHDHGPKLSERTLANMGVEVGEAAVSDFVRTIDVPAEVEALPQAERPLTSPVAGVVRTVHVRAGQVVAAGALVAEVVRDPLPQPTLSLTESILKPLNEDHHEAAVAVRTAALALSLARAERERLAGLGAPAGGPERVVGRVVRDAEYAERRAKLDLDNALHEAERHGMTDEQIEQLQRGEGDGEVPDVPDVRRVLLRNRLWSEDADAVLALLPERLRAVPHSVALLGELVGSGRLSPALVAALREAAPLREAFVDVVGMIQAGATPQALLDLAQRGGLDPVVRLHAPADGAPSFDVASVVLRPSERVEAGAPVVRLRDDRRMALRLAPAPADLGPLACLLADATTLTAEPLVRGACDALSDVRLVSLVGGGDGAAPSALAHAPNEVLAEVELEGGVKARSWTLRPGLRFLVRVPVEKRPGRFVLPADAIAYRGAEAVVLLKVGTAFKPVPVRLEHHDARVAVVAADGAIFPGDSIVMSGAPALALGLLAGAGAGDPHAGHHH